MVRGSLRLAARRAWRLARALHVAPAGTCLAAKLHSAQAARNFSLTLPEEPTGSGHALANFTETEGYWGASAWEKRTLGSLRTYKQLNGNLLVPTLFVIPAGDNRWPSTTWGYKLGRAVRSLRSRLGDKASLSTEMREELDKLGFVANASQFKWGNIVLPALWQFRKVHGHADVPQGFVVPSGDDAWPRLAWGYGLGHAVMKIRRGEAFSSHVASSKAELDQMGFCYGMSISDRNWDGEILPSIRVYRQEFGDCRIPTSFVVPSSPPWPEKAWGLRLGNVARDIRSKTYYREHVARDKGVLDAVGFVWNWSDAEWKEAIVPVLEVYAELYQNCNIPSTFIVPSEDPWPRKAWTKRLGAILAQVRSRGSYFPQYGRDIDKLDELGWNTKLSLQMWNKLVVPLLDTYMELHGEGEVPVDFVIPSEVPWDENMWGVRLGLVVARNLRFISHKR